MTAQLCVTVTAGTTAELRRKRDAVVDADLVELRLDTVSDPDVAGALNGRRRPVIVTCRPAWEGGQFRGAEEDRLRLLDEALVRGAEFVDVEWRAGFGGLVDRAADRVVLSMHDFNGVPDDLVDRATAMRATGAAVVKVAVAMHRLSDCLPLAALGAQSTHRHRAVLIGMGEFGLPTRVLAARFGSQWTYAGELGTVGQLTPGELLDFYRFRSLTAVTGVYGLAGSPVTHSVSPAMHNAAFQATDVDAVYLPLRAADALDFERFGRAFGIKGASVTIPFKVALFERVDEVSAVARRIGAINTIRAEGGRWVAGNTDAAAFLEPLRDRVSLAGKRVAVLGAGGAARAVAVALSSTGAAITIHARNVAQAEEVAMTIGAAVGGLQPAPGSWDVLVNCTPIGMYPRAGDTPVPAAQLTGELVYDLVYNPTTTRLMREAERAGCQTIGGLEMLVAQAHEQFEWWTGIRPPIGIMKDAAVRRLAEFTRHEDHVV